MKRFFIVGCSRSGTSIVQKSVIENFGLWTMPETGFYLRNLDSLYGRISALAGLYFASTDRDLENRYLDAIRSVFFLSKENGFIKVALSIFSEAGIKNLFLSCFDDNSGRRGMPGWLEKTPRHFYKYEEICKHINDAKFIFVIRKGEDVVASIVDRARKFPDQFAGQDKLEYGIKLWNESIATADRIKNNENVIIISYEDFVRSPEQQLDRIGMIFDIKYSETPGGHGIKVARSSEKWKSDIGKGVLSVSSKFSHVFNEREKEEVLRGLDVSKYESVCRSIEST